MGAPATPIPALSDSNPPQTPAQQLQARKAGTSNQGNAPQGGTIVRSKNGVPFLFMGGNPSDPKNYKPVSGGQSAGQ